MLPLVLLELSNLSPQERATYLSAASSLPSLPPAGKQLPGLASTSPSSCRGQMIMVDDRSLVDTNERVVKAVAINWLVAQRYGWSFTLVRPHQRREHPPFSVMWCKLTALASMIRQTLTTEQQDCTWLLYIDADAFVRDAGIDLIRHVASLAEAARAEFVISREDGGDELQARLEDGSPFGLREAPFLFNTGVLFVRASNWSAHFLCNWFKKRNTLCAGTGDNDLRTHWPGEQKCLDNLFEESFLRPNESALSGQDRRKIMHAPMTLFNSPWGRYVTHRWSGRGGESVEWAMDHELRSVYRVFNLSAFVQSTLLSDPPHSEGHLLQKRHTCDC